MSHAIYPILLVLLPGGGFQVKTEQSMVSSGLILPALASAAKFKQNLQKLHIE
jgi:hypothetical protein